MNRIAFIICVLLGCDIACGQQPGYESFEDGVPPTLPRRERGA